MANEMGNQALDGKANELEESRYLIKRYSKLPEDFRNKILANLLNSLRYGNDYFKLIEKENYFSNYPVFIERLMNQSEFKIAMLPDETILGWSMFNGKILHYIWVAKHQQRQGIGLALLPKEIDSFSHLTNKGIKLWLKHFSQAEFKPFV